MPTEIWSRIKLGVCGPPLCWGQTAILKHFERSLLAWVEGRVGSRASSFWENVSRSQKAIWLDLGVNSYYLQRAASIIIEDEQLSPRAKTHRKLHKGVLRIILTLINHQIPFLTWVQTDKTTVEGKEVKKKGRSWCNFSNNISVCKNRIINNILSHKWSDFESFKVSFLTS